MSAGTVISGGFPGRVAQEVQPNSKCNGCLHFDGQAGRIGACTIGLRPWLCGDGDAADVGYAPISHGAGSYLPGMSTHDSQAREVEPQFVSDLYGAGSTKPIQVQQVSLGEEHVHFIKSMVDNHASMQRSMCRLCKSRGTTIGTSPANVGPQACTCEPIAARTIAKALTPRISNRDRSVMSLDDVVAFVYDVAKAGYKMPLEKASLYHTSGRYDVSHAGDGSGKHHVDFHPHGGGQSARIGTFGSRSEARHATESHAQRFAAGSARTTPSTPQKTNPGHANARKTPLPSMSGAVSLVHKALGHGFKPGDKVHYSSSAGFKDHQPATVGNRSTTTHVHLKSGKRSFMAEPHEVRPAGAE